MDKSILRKALADTPEPTPGYLYRDIVQMTFADQSTQQKLLCFLFDKLSPSTSVHVLNKTLKVIKNLCETGHTDFQREVQRLNDRLMEFASFRGKLDPRLNDALNEKVRQSAKAAIEAAFSARKNAQKMQVTAMGSDATSVNAPTSFKTGVSVAGPSGANSHCAPMPTSNKWADQMAKHGQAPGVTEGGGVFTDLKQNVVAGANTGFGMWKEGLKTEQQRVIEGLSAGPGNFRPVELPSSGFGHDATTTRGGGGGGGGGGGWQFVAEQNGGGDGAPTPVVEAKMLSVVEREVDRLAVLKSAPARVDLTNFLTNVISLGEQGEGKWDEVAQALDCRLAQSKPWQTRLNSLCMIEHLARHGGAPAGLLREYFVENPEDLQRNQHVVQATLKEKAVKVMRLLSIPDKVSSQQQQQQQEMQRANVITTAGGTSWGPAAATSSSATAAAAAPGQLDFGGMTVAPSARRGGNVGGGEQPVDKTKLKKRAIAQLAPSTSTAFDANAGSGGGGGWGNGTTGASDGWVGAEATTAQSGGGGWGPGWGDAGVTTAPATASQPPLAAAAVTPAVGGGSNIDDLFAAPGPTPTATSVTTPQLQNSNGQPTAAGIDSLFSGMPAVAAVQAPHPAMMAPQPAMMAPQPTMMAPQPAMMAPQPAMMAPQPAMMAPQPAMMAPQPAVMAPQPAMMAPLAPQPAGQDIDLGRVRQQMAQMQTDMAQAMAALGQGDMTAQPRVQQLMAEQQQLMALLSAAPRAQAPPPRESVAAGAFPAPLLPPPPPQPEHAKAANPNAQFAMLSAEMKSIYGH